MPILSRVVNEECVESNELAFRVRESGNMENQARSWNGSEGVGSLLAI